MPGYATTARLLHWIVAVLVLLTIPAGMIMVQEGLPRALQNALFLYHKNVGVLVLLLVVTRLVYRRAVPPPPFPPAMPAWQRRAAAVSHAGLYLMLLVMPVSGYIRVRAGDFPVESLDKLGVPPLVPVSKPLESVAQTTHWIGHFLIIALVSLHILAALNHAFLRRDGVFSRMWPPYRT